MRHKKPIGEFMAEQIQGAAEYRREYMREYVKAHHQEYNRYQREYKREHSKSEHCKKVEEKPVLSDLFFDGLRSKLSGKYNDV